MKSGEVNFLFCQLQGITVREKDLYWDIFKFCLWELLFI